MMPCSSAETSVEVAGGIGEIQHLVVPDEQHPLRHALVEQVKRDDRRTAESRVVADEHGTGLVGRDLRDHPLKTTAISAAVPVAKVVLDDLDLIRGPSPGLGESGQVALVLGTTAVVPHLRFAALANVNQRLPRQVRLLDFGSG